MIGVLYIDGVDVYSSYGVSLSETSYDDLVCLPNLKPIAFNDWHEKNGIEPDLSSPVLDAKTITIPFHVIGTHSRITDFMLAFANTSYHSFNFAAIGLTKDLRLVSCGDLRSIGNLTSFTLTFSDDAPMKDYVYAAPSSDISRLGDYLLDGRDFADYGIRILGGTMASIKKAPAVKENLKRDISVSTGVIYDGEIVTYKSRTAHLKCFMRASNPAEFWRNRNALVYDLSKPGERTLTVSELGKEIPCFYKDCSVSSFFPDMGKYWFEFTLGLEFFKGVI